MQNKYILLIVCLLFTGMWACDKNDDSEMGNNMRNTRRVKEISGHNEQWGDFKMLCGYSKERLDSAGVFTADGKRKGRIEAVYEGDKVELTVSKRIPSVSPDSVAKLDPDSVPMYSATIYQVGCTFNGEQEKNVTYSYYGPIEPEVEGEFVVGYEVKYKESYINEYDAEGRVCVWRSPENLKYNLPFRKCEVNYDGSKLAGLAEYVYRAGGWKLNIKDDFTYAGDLLNKVVSNDVEGNKVLFERSFSYTGNTLNQISTVMDGKTAVVAYMVDNEGYVTKIDYGGGNYMNISYEAGNGNFSLLTTVIDRLSGMPYIK